MQELSKTHDEIPTLATRAQLDTWFDEHDKIEKETEVFDAGDLKKLKAVTKGEQASKHRRQDLRANLGPSCNTKEFITRRHRPH